MATDFPDRTLLVSGVFTLAFFLLKFSFDCSTLFMQATSALAEVVDCCPHNTCEGSGSSPHKSIVGAKCSLYFQKNHSPLRNVNGVWTSLSCEGLFV